jgi:glucan phosphorylase
MRLDLSLEFLMGRALDNAMLNVEQKDVAASKPNLFLRCH